MASLSLDSTLVASDEHTSTTVDDEMVILNTRRGLYQGLDGIGPHVWELLEEPMTIRSLRDELLEEYDVSAEQCERDLLSFLEELMADGLIEITDARD